MPDTNAELREEFFKTSSWAGELTNTIGVAHQNGTVLVRDDSHPHKGTWAFTQAEWKAFVVGVKRGEFDFDFVPKDT